ncbi:MAG TPA: OmpH family outer membrane protein [Steroidobacteraceae bacterium]|nr:OmpH family outer membrane protein [Steroidobacteraceae bacterium]
MKRSIPLLLSTATLGLFAASTATAEIKIGVVNTARLMAEAPQAKLAIDGIRTEFAPREREIQTTAAALKAREDKLTKDAATMTEVQRAAAEKELRDGYRDLQRKQSEVQDDFNARRNEEMSKLNRTLAEEVQAFAKAQGFDLILTDGVIYATNALDVTGPVLTALQARRTGGAAAAPAPAPAKPAASATKP